MTGWLDGARLAPSEPLTQNEGVIALPLETWVSIGTLLGVAVTMFVAMRSGFSDLRLEINGLRSEMKDEFKDVRAELKDVRAELKADLAALEGRVTELDRRVYALAVGLRPYVGEAQEGSPSGHTG